MTYFDNIEMTELAIVILNFNGRNHLETFLPSVVANSTPHKLIIIDNASTDNSKEFVSEKYPEIEWIQLQSNFGFAQGYNEGLQRIEGKYSFYLLLNSDVEVTPNYLDPLLLQIKKETIAVVQPKILSYSNRRYFEHAGASGGFIDKNGFPFCRGRIFNECEADLGQYNHAQPIFWASGACFLVKSKLFHQAGGFDPDFYAHMEEIDLCWRLQKEGHEIWVEPASSVFHLGGGTLSYDSPEKVRLNFRNNLYMLIKNSKGFWPIVLFRRMIWDGIAAIMFLLKGKPNLFYKVLQAHFQMYLNLPKMIRKRELKSYELLGKFNGNIVINFYIKQKKFFSQITL